VGVEKKRRKIPDEMQMKFLKPLLRIKKLDRERKKAVREKRGGGGCRTLFGNRTESTKVAQHFLGMDSNRIPKQAPQYEEKGRRNIGSLRKRWRDQLHTDG